MKRKTQESVPRTQAELARRVGLKSRQLLHGYLKCGLNTTQDVAKQLAVETGTDMGIWLRTNNPITHEKNLATRQAAYEAWLAGQPFSTN